MKQTTEQGETPPNGCPLSYLRSISQTVCPQARMHGQDLQDRVPCDTNADRVLPFDSGESWVLANSIITTTILGASRLEQLDDSLAAPNYAVDPELKEQLDDLTAEYHRGDADR